MLELFSDQGLAELQALARRAPLLGFDFDGTLAPLVGRPDDAFVSPELAARLRRLAATLPVVILTGRDAHDVEHRLGFRPAVIIGNHGAERWPSPAPTRDPLDGVRQELTRRKPALQQHGIEVESKRLSIALHYRHSRDAQQAADFIMRTLRDVGPQVEIFGGKFVFNVVPAGAPDKAHALRALLAEFGAACALYVGDDVNDETVFAARMPQVMTVRIGACANSQARYFLAEQSALQRCLDHMLDEITATAPGRDNTRSTRPAGVPAPCARTHRR